MDLSARIKLAREHAKLSRTELAEQMEPPVRFESVRAWETGITEPRPKNLRTIAKVTKVRYEWLSAEGGPMVLGEASNAKPTIADISSRVRAMSREERLLWLRAIAEAESQDT